MDLDKVENIQEWPQPLNLHELRSFIGMCSYYRRFIEKFSIIAIPLHDLTKKKAKFQWIAKENDAFNELKKRLMFAPLLILLDLTKTFEFHCDASSDSLGAVLSQEGHPIAYESHCLQPQEQYLAIHKKNHLQ